MPKGLLNAKLQSNLDAGGFAITNLSGGLSGSGFLAISNNLGDAGLVPATMRTNIGLPASTAGQNILNLSGPGATKSFLQVLNNTPAYRSMAQTLSDIGAQAASANLTTWSGVTASALGLSLCAASTPGTTSYLQGTSGGAVAFKTAAQAATDILSGLTISPSTGSFKTDATVIMGAFNSVGTTTVISGNLTVSVPAITLSGAGNVVLNFSGATTLAFPSSGTVSTLTGLESLTNKTLTSPIITGATVSATASLGVRSSGIGAFDVRIKNTENLTAQRDLTVTVNDAARTIDMTGNLVTRGLTTTGNTIAMAATGVTSITLPLTGTLSTLGGAETLTAKTINDPILSFGGKILTVSLSNSATLNVGSTGTAATGVNNFSTASQAISAATRTYITGSKITVPSNKLQIGTMFTWKFNITKTAAGTAASTIDVCVGTNGTTADTARLTFTKPAGTAVADEGFVTIEAIVRGPLSASGIMVGEMIVTHNLAATGHMIIPVACVNVFSIAFDVTTANLFVGVCLTTGASDAITIQQVSAQAWNL